MKRQKKIIEKNLKYERNKLLWNKFLNNYLIINNMHKNRIDAYYRVVREFEKYIDKEFDKVTRDDVINFVADKIMKKYDSVYTRNELKNLLRKFLKFIFGEDTKIIKDIKLEKVKEINFIDKILTEEEIKRMIEVAKNIRDKAVISLLYETGTRATEIVSLNVGDVKFKEIEEGKEVAYVMIRKSKTIQRPILIVDSIIYLKRWLNEHPFKNDDSAPLWVNMYHDSRERLSYLWLYVLIKNIAKKAGIKKEIYPHIFRHSRATHLAKKGLNEFELRKIFGWSSTSKTPSIYVHLTMQDIEEEMLSKVYNLKVEKKEEKNVLSNIICWNCKTTNPSINKFCAICGSNLHLSEEEKLVKKLKKELFEKEEVKIMLKQTLKKVIEKDYKLLDEIL